MIKVRWHKDGEHWITSEHGLEKFWAGSTRAQIQEKLEVQAQLAGVSADHTPLDLDDAVEAIYAHTSRMAANAADADRLSKRKT